MEENKGTVISSRIRLARNLDGYVFPSMFKQTATAHGIIKKISAAANRIEKFTLHYMNSMSDAKAEALIEKHLISRALSDNKRISAVLISEDESVSIMINEEDHLREQCFYDGMALDRAYARLNAIDSAIEATVKFAYDDKLGYLTACPTNIGTGMRASVMMFLPATTINGKIERVINDVTRLGLTVRGVYGEGSTAKGYRYQVSNERTLGLDETTILGMVKYVVNKLSEIEKIERASLKGNLDIKDMTMRSLGILMNCAKLTEDELISYAASVKLGIQLGYINIDDVSSIDDMVVDLQAVGISEKQSGLSTEKEREIYRAVECGKRLRMLKRNVI